MTFSDYSNITFDDYSNMIYKNKNPSDYLLLNETLLLKDVIRQKIIHIPVEKFINNYKKYNNQYNEYVIDTAFKLILDKLVSNEYDIENLYKLTQNDEFFIALYKYSGYKKVYLPSELYEIADLF